MTNSLRRLEFQKVLEYIAKKTESEAGHAKVMSLNPGWNRKAADELQHETENAAVLIDHGIRVPAGGSDGLREVCSLLENGVTLLDPFQLRAVGLILASLDGFIQSVESTRDKGYEYPALEKYLNRIPRLRKLSDWLISITTQDGELSSDASKELHSLSKLVARLKRKLSKKIDMFSSSLSGKNVLREIPPTVRDGRYVLPVISSRKKDVQGIVHDRSESGETIFIEPSVLVEDGNALREASLDFDYEKRKIIRDASHKIMGHLDHLKDCLEASSSLDAIFARASFHRKSDTVFPSEGNLSLINLRHPLISEKEIVSNNVVLPEDWRVLIVSGPNAGGKSVLLKAVGLAIVSTQSGIGCFADAESTLPFFDRIHVSMGDQQSIARHQSTYSARLLEQLEMLNDPGDSSIALIDEPAAGTDPLTGAALAASVLEYLAALGSRLIVTTHQGQLKSFAQGRQGFYNGCMNFQSDSLQPDYSFIPGTPGSSFTLEIARKMHFPETVLSRARELSGDSFKLDRILEEIASTRQKVKLEISDLEREREEGRKSIERKITELDKARNDFLMLKGRLRKDYLEIESSINSRADSLLARLAKAESTDERRKLRAMIRKVSEIPLDLSELSEISDGPFDQEIEPGDWVSVKGWSGFGKVEQTGKGQASVILGNLRLRKSIRDLRKVPAPDEKPASAGWSVPVEAETELDLRGMSADEALSELDRALDDGIVACIPYINVIHGKGMGILMKAVVDMVRYDKRVADFRQGKPSEGGTGVTIVSLDYPEKKS